MGGGTVDYHYIPGALRQLDSYNIALQKYKRQYRYMAFLDCDEFMYGEKSLYETIDELFQKQTDMGGLGVNWLHFGSAGHESRPKGGVIENYKWRAKEDFFLNKIMKTVVIPARTMALVSPHYAVYRKGYTEFDEKGRKTVRSATATVTTRNIRINHYFTKSKEDWIEKVNRGRADITALRKMEEFELCDKNEVFDDRLWKAIETMQSQKAK